jgi:hypothetical protein
MFKIADLISIVDEYRRVTGTEDRTVSSRVFADSKKLGALRSGADITTSRFNDAVMWFSENWPNGAVWPVGLDRPALDQKVAAE